jgi:hypothetical protein
MMISGEECCSFDQDCMEQPSYWLKASCDSFVFYNYCMLEVFRIYNAAYCLLTSQNLLILMEMIVASVMHRIGIQNGFTMIGMTVVVADLAGKGFISATPQTGMRLPVPIRNIYKSTSVGFDVVREVVDFLSTMCQHLATVPIDESELKLSQVSLVLYQ